MAAPKATEAWGLQKKKQKKNSYRIGYRELLSKGRNVRKTLTVVQTYDLGIRKS